MLSKKKIAELCTANEVIADAYKKFRTIHPLKPIDDIWAMTHFSTNTDEAFIQSCGRRYHYINGELKQ